MMKAIRVLYAEDDAADADLTKRHFALHAPEFELEVVNTGKRCLARLENCEFDALILDNHLPDMDGVDVLKEGGHGRFRLPVVMVTGVGDEALVIQVLRLGAVDYVPKDGNYIQNLPTVLKAAIAEYRNRLEHGRASGDRQQHILYVEHNSTDIDLTLKYFAESAAQFRMEVVNSFQQAITILCRDNFDLVLADLRMPDMSALDFLQEAKRRALCVPVIIITGRGDEAAAVAALKLGALEYMVKRENYLTQLPYAIENAIARAELRETNQRLRTELTARRQAESENDRLLAEVRGQRRRMAEIIASVEGVVWEARGNPAGPDQQLEFISDHVERMLGYSVQHCLATPNFWLSIVEYEDREHYVREAAEFFACGKNGISQFRSTAADGRVVWLEARYAVICEGGSPVGIRGVAIDISDRKQAEQANARLEEELQQARKMECIGRLAGGVAHDFNNLLTVINGYSQMMADELGPTEPLRSPLEEIHHAGERAADLTRQLLAFSRKQLLEPKALSLNSLITDSIQMLKRLMGEDIEVVTILGSELGQVKADSSQMNQVILNLAVNARDAMPRGGKLTLETSNVILDERFAQKWPAVRPGRYVNLSVCDTGRGMDSQTLSQMFEPFFTTKEPGKGTGLGLSTVYGIVKQSGGWIWADSEIGRGTRMQIFLPHIESSSAEGPTESIERKDPGGSETILVVEDEEAVRTLICHMLRSHGYEVIEASNGNDALIVCGSRSGQISLMISDVVMPQMSGGELADRVRELHPEMLVLYISGYTDDAIVRHGLLQHSAGFLQKPFTHDTLARKVRSVLDQQTQRAALQSGV
jgi:PAS domain S-box-containing protein